MATPTKTYTFTAGTPAAAAEVNQNFDDVLDFLENEVAHLDGSNAFTSIPSGPSSNPSSDDQFARKAYVDSRSSRVVQRKVHTTISEYADGTSRTDFDVNFTFVVPTLLSGQYLKVSADIPKVEIAQDSAWPELGTALKVYLETSGIGSGNSILAYGQTQVPDALGYDPEGATSLYFQRLWSSAELVSAGMDPGDTVTVKSKGALTTSDGKFRLRGETGSPVQFVIEVV